VHGKASHGFISQLIEIARKSEKSAYVGSGENRIHAVHYLDVAALFRLTLHWKKESLAQNIRLLRIRALHFERLLRRSPNG
jgi:hypothetical protein